MSLIKDFLQKVCCALSLIIMFFSLMLLAPGIGLAGVKVITLAIQKAFNEILTEKTAAYKYYKE